MDYTPPVAKVRLAFTIEDRRKQRRSDGTCCLEGVRFEIPSRYAHFQWVSLRVARWDLSRVYLSDPATGAILCRLFPLDKHKNAQGQRAARSSPSAAPLAPTPNTPAPLLQKLIKEYAATGLPPAYLPKDEVTPTTDPADTNPS
jgi:putative transposase